MPAFPFVPLIQDLLFKSENVLGLRGSSLQPFDCSLKSTICMLRQRQFFEVNFGRGKTGQFWRGQDTNSWLNINPKITLDNVAILRENCGIEENFCLWPFPQPNRKPPPQKRLPLSKARKHLPRKRGVYREKWKLWGSGKCVRNYVRCSAKF